jgi:hypothetical protein
LDGTTRRRRALGTYVHAGSAERHGFAIELDGQVARGAERQNEFSSIQIIILSLKEFSEGGSLLASNGRDNFREVVESRRTGQ